MKKINPYDYSVPQQQLTDPVEILKVTVPAYQDSDVLKEAFDTLMLKLVEKEIPFHWATPYIGVVRGYVILVKSASLERIKELLEEYNKKLEQSN